VRRPVVEPLHDTRATGDVILHLARAVGGAVADAFPWRSFRAAMEARFQGLRAARRGSILADDDRHFLARLYAEGFWTETHDTPPRPVTFTFHPVDAEPAWRGDPAAFPLRLLVYRPVGYAHGSGANQPWLHVLRDRPGTATWSTQAALHPDAAPGVRDGDRVEVKSPWGAITLVARLDRRMEPDIVAIPAGGGHQAFGRFARGVTRLRGFEPSSIGVTNRPFFSREIRLRRGRSRRRLAARGGDQSEGGDEKSQA